MIASSVTSIRWERVNVTLTVALSEPVSPPRSVEFFLVDQPKQFPITHTHRRDDRYDLHINVTNFRHRSEVPDGCWRIVPYLDGVPQRPAGYPLDDLESLDEQSRTFLYANDQMAYVIALAMSDDDSPALLVRAYKMSRRPTSNSIASQRSVSRRVRDRAHHALRRVRFLNHLYRVCRRANPLRGNRILFASEARETMEGNLLRIHDRMVERGLDATWDIQCSFRTPVTRTPQSTARLVRLLATSDVVVIDDYFSLLEELDLSPQTRVIQAWHAGSGFKSTGYSRFGRHGSIRLHNAHRKYSYVIVGSRHLVGMYAEAFGIEESAVIPTGLPRIDTFLDSDRTARIRSEFFRMNPRLRGKRIILFAPTFRGRDRWNAYYDYRQLDFKALWEMCGDDSVFCFRMHYFITDPVPIPADLSDRLIDLASYGATNDLLHVTSVLITDYSSIIYEFSLLDRPMVFYAYDRAVYSATRGFHRDYEQTAPGKVCETFDELVRALSDHDYETWKIARFREQNVDGADTNSADRVIDQLILGDPPADLSSIGEPTTLDLATDGPGAGRPVADGRTASGEGLAGNR